ncbi:MAG: hemolysin family protein [Microbacteriaceae bacterium]|nr:hemolysin family protein [Microbacteriaceae bacterium]
MSEWIQLGLAALLTLGTGLFVASEFALVNTDRTELESRQASGEKRLRLPILAVKRTSTHLSAAQLGITLTTLLTGFLAEPAISSLLSPWLTGLGLGESTVSVLGAVIALTIATLVSFLFGELVPKNMALSVPIGTLKAIAIFQIAFTYLFYFIIIFLNNTGNFFVRRFGVEPKEELSAARSAEELSSLVMRSASLGSLEENTATLLSRTLRLAELNASEIMTPRPKMNYLDSKQSAADVIVLSIDSGHSRFPVTGEDVDDIIGAVHLKHALAVPMEKRETVPVSALMQDVIRVPETMSLERLTLDLRERGLQIAIVIDEYGGTAGMATLEDLVEEIVGELDDEHDERLGNLTVVSGDQVSFSGLKRPDELEAFGIEIPDSDDYDTASGFVMTELGRVPEVGDEVELETGVIRVALMDGRRIDRLRFIRRSIDE